MKIELSEQESAQLVRIRAIGKEIEQLKQRESAVFTETQELHSKRLRLETEWRDLRMSLFRSMSGINEEFL